MFNRPKCKRCNEKISKKYNFCPHCGFSQKGKDSEFFQPTLDNLGLPFPLKHMIKSLSKQLEKELKQAESSPPTFDEDPKINHNPTQGFPGGTMGVSINIDSKNGQPVIRINSPDKNRKQLKTNIPKSSLTEEKVEKFSSLPREEPETKVKRLTNRLVYEINIPGVPKENIIIRKLENSIEIKAFSDNKAYFKLIPLSLPLLKSNLDQGKLILELKI